MTVLELLLCIALLAAAREAAGTQAEREAALAQCADCHPSEAASYARTGMARALEPLRAGELAGLAPVPDEKAGFRYSFEEGSIVEELLAEDARPWRDSAPLAFAIGAGELDRSFVLKRGERMWLAPLEVLRSEAGAHAELSPPHAIGPGSRFGLAVTPECLGCHTDAMPPRDWPLNAFAPGWKPRGISCGACHTGIVEHVKHRSAELGGEATTGADSIADLASQSRTARMDVCAACHLQGDARIELLDGRIGPPPPGTDLLATRAVFVARQPTAEIGFVSHVQRLVLSRCYLESGGFPGGGLSCETCHDPHRSVFEADERARVRAACGTCHEDPTVGPRAASCKLAPEQRAKDRDCVDCHMRRTGVFDVAQVKIHDHWIQGRIGPPSGARALRFPESPGGDWTIFHWPEAPAPDHARDSGLWTMALAHRGHLERALAEVIKGPGAFGGKLAMLHHVRGSVLERAGRQVDARAEYEQALKLDPLLAESSINLGAVLTRLGRLPEASKVLEQVLARYPRADSALRNRAALRLAQGDEAGAYADLEAAQRLLPSAQVAATLARIAEARGDAQAVRRWEAEARQLDPRGP